jgi:hypothetical protein
LERYTLELPPFSCFAQNVFDSHVDDVIAICNIDRDDIYIFRSVVVWAAEAYERAAESSYPRLSSSAMTAAALPLSYQRGSAQDQAPMEPFS